MTLLDICTQVANDIPVAAPATIIGNTDPTAVQLLARAKLAGKDVARKPPGGWVSSIREYDFFTAARGPLAGTIANTGPGGVARITGLSSTNGITALTWYAFGTFLPSNAIIATVDSGTQVTLNVAASSTGAGTYNFGQSDYSLPPDFSRAIDNTLWDRSRFWAMRGPLSPQQWQLYKSSVIGRASIQRRFRFRRIGGSQVISIDPVPTDNGSALVLEYVSTAYCQSASGVAQTEWQADTDVGVVDEYLIQLNLMWRMLRRLGMSYSEELDEYERQLDKARATDGASAILDMTPSNQLHLIGPFQIPDGNFPG